jgi:hypothetical protein
MAVDKPIKAKAPVKTAQDELAELEAKEAAARRAAAPVVEEAAAAVPDASEAVDEDRQEGVLS